MAYEFYCNLEFQSGFISGMLAGRSLNCLINPSQASAPAGVYQIQPPIDDVVFGQLAVMTPVSGAASGYSATKFEWAPGASDPFYKPWGDEPSVGNKKYVGASASSFDKAIKMVGPGGASGAYEWSDASASRGKQKPDGTAVGFILSSRPIPGRNCLVIQSNFDDLMDALKSTGGATVRFA